MRGAVLLALFASTAQALPAPTLEEHLNRPLPFELAFRDGDDHAVRLSDVVQSDRPTVLILSYFECPMLCGLVEKGTVSALKAANLRPEDVNLVTVSFDPRDTPANAKRKSQNAALELPDFSWRFLVGDARTIERLEESTGFQAVFDDATRQFAHPAAILVLTPQGRIARYLYGIEYPPRDLRLAIQEAREGRGGPAFDRFLLTCFRYDPTTRRYGPWVFGFLRLGAAIVAISLAGAIGLMLRRERVRGRS